MERHQGTSIFPGIVLAKGHWMFKAADSLEAPYLGEAEEKSRFEKAVLLTVEQIQAIKQIAEKKMNAKEADIFEAHTMMAQDPEFIDAVNDEIRLGTPASKAIANVTDSFVQILSKASSAYLRERVVDLKDVSSRMIRNLNPKNSSKASLASSILIAEDLAPSDLMELSSAPPLGVALEKGGLTSHTAILLKALGIPSVFSLNTLNLEKPSEEGGETTLILDAQTGQLILDADSKTLADYQGKSEKEKKQNAALEQWKTKPTVMKCGTKVQLFSNVASNDQLRLALANGAEGVGLYRTEFLFMDRSQPPAEEEQFQTYKEAAELLAGRTLTIRTMDVGGDKQIPYMNLPKEENPFLGVRGLRLSFQHPELFATQIRALLRASEFGPLDVMFPMVTEPEEIERAFELIERQTGGKPLSEFSIKWGMMLEIPVNIFMIPELSKRLDFFSVGTNDLGQYLTACDRQNSNLQHLNTPFSPGFLRALRYLAEQVQLTGRRLSVCGEVAADPLLSPVLLGLGVHKLSQNSRVITTHRELFSRMSLEECEELADACLKLGSAQEIKQALKKNRE